MTRKEVTELFGVMLLAWPNAEMFKGGVQKLGPTIELWAKCLPDVDFWTGQQALIRLCQICKFPPTIAEFREQVGTVNTDIDRRCEFEWSRIRLDLDAGQTPQEIFDGLPPGSLSRLAITAIGGPDKIIQPCGLLNYYGFEEAFRNAIKAQGALPGGNHQKVGSESRQAAATLDRYDNRIRRNNHGKRYVCSN